MDSNAAARPEGGGRTSKKLEVWSVACGQAGATSTQVGICALCDPGLCCFVRPPPSSRNNAAPVQQQPLFRPPCTNASLPPGPARPPTASTSRGKCEAEPVTSAETASGQPGGGEVGGEHQQEGG